MKKTLLSGVKPTGRPHIGNYFGAMKQFVELLNSGDYDCYFFIADYHALNFIQNKEEMRRNTLDLAIDYLAIGLDPKKATIFKQSDVSAHTELAWIFDTIVTIPFLARSHAFKAAIEKFTDATPARRFLSSKLEQLTDVNVGTFNYPVLMAADILLYDTDVVPVGQDQKQHVEYARDIALKFNNVFGGPKDADGNTEDPIFKLPEPLILEDVAVVPGIDGRKMSKSYGNTIPLFATDDEIQKIVMSIPTDSKDVTEPKDPNSALFKLYTLFEHPEASKIMREQFLIGGVGYKEFKEILIQLIQKFVRPLRERRAELASDENAVLEVLKEGADKASEKANAKLLMAKKAIGVS